MPGQAAGADVAAAVKKSTEFTGSGARAIVKVVQTLVADAGPGRLVDFPELDRDFRTVALERLRQALEEHALPYAHVTKGGRLKCPKCRTALPDRSKDGQVSGEFRWVEDIGSERQVLGQDDKTVAMDSHYGTDGYDESAEAERLFCVGCSAEFVLPEGFEPEFL